MPTVMVEKPVVPHCNTAMVDPLVVSVSHKVTLSSKMANNAPIPTKAVKKDCSVFALETATLRPFAQTTAMSPKVKTKTPIATVDAVVA